MLNSDAHHFESNQCLINPAFAGVGQGIKVNAAYRKLWNNVPGSPLTQNLTVDYGFNKVGLGLSVNNESAGLQRQTRSWELCLSPTIEPEQSAVTFRGVAWLHESATGEYSSCRYYACRNLNLLPFLSFFRLFDVIEILRDFRHRWSKVI